MGSPISTCTCVRHFLSTGNPNCWKNMISTPCSCSYRICQLPSGETRRSTFWWQKLTVSATYLQMHQAIWREEKLQTTPHDFQSLTISGFPLPSSGFPLPISGFTQEFQFFLQRNLRVPWKLLGFPGKLQNFREHFRIFPCPVPVFLHPFPLLPRNSGFSQETCVFSGNSWVFPGNFRFSVNTSGLLLKTFWLSLETSRFSNWTSWKIPWKLLVFSGHFSVSFEFSCGNLTVFFGNPKILLDYSRIILDFSK